MLPKIVFEVLMWEVAEQHNRQEQDDGPKRDGLLLPNDEGEAGQCEDKNDHCRNYEVSKSQGKHDWQQDQHESKVSLSPRLAFYFHVCVIR